MGGRPAIEGRRDQDDRLRAPHQALFECPGPALTLGPDHERLGGPLAGLEEVEQALADLVGVGLRVVVVEPRHHDDEDGAAGDRLADRGGIERVDPVVFEGESVEGREGLHARGRPGQEPLPEGGPIRRLEPPGDRAGSAIADRSAVDLDDRQDLDRRPGQERLVDPEEVVEGDVALGDRDALVLGQSLGQESGRARQDGRVVGRPLDPTAPDPEHRGVRGLGDPPVRVDQERLVGPRPVGRLQGHDVGQEVRRLHVAPLPPEVGTRDDRHAVGPLRGRRGVVIRPDDDQLGRRHGGLGVGMGPRGDAPGDVDVGRPFLDLGGLDGPAGRGRAGGRGRPRGTPSRPGSCANAPCAPLRARAGRHRVGRPHRRRLRRGSPDPRSGSGPHLPASSHR